MRWVSRLVTIAIALAGVTAIAIAVVLTVRQSNPYHFRTSAAFRDGSQLPVGSRVMIAGVQVGRIVGLTVDGRLARVSMRLRDDVELYDDAWAEKQIESLFGDGYLEIHAGTPGHRRLESGEPIPRTVDEVSPDRTLRSLDQAMPRAREVLAQAQRYTDGLRRTVDGELGPRLEALDRRIRDPELVAPLERADDAMGRFERATDEAAVTVARARTQVAPALDRFDRQVTDATDDLRGGARTVHDELAGARASLDKVDPYVEDARDLVARLDGDAPPDDQGTLGRLINDPALGDTIADTAESGADATASLTRFASYVGLRTEFNVLSRQAYVSFGLEIAGSHDNYYLLEVAERDSGIAPRVTLTSRPDGTYVRTAEADERLLFTAQWGHRFDWLSVRFGLHDNDFSVGVDTALAHGRLELRSDLFVPAFELLPRLKLTAAMRVFRDAYVIAGIDDALHGGRNVAVAPWPAGQDVPEALDEVHDGRDYFLGAYLRFTDRDLDALLMLYGAAVFSAL